MKRTPLYLALRTSLLPVVGLSVILSTSLQADPFEDAFSELDAETPMNPAIQQMESEFSERQSAFDELDAEPATESATFPAEAQPTTQAIQSQQQSGPQQSPTVISQPAPVDNDPFAELERQAASINPDAETLAAEESEFQQWKDQQAKEYEEFRAAYLEALNNYRNEILEYWPEAEVTSKTALVEYEDDMRIKRVVDYENNEIRISILDAELDGEIDQEALKKKAREQLQKLIAETPNSVRKNDPVLKAVNANQEVDDEINKQSVLSELFDEGKSAEQLTESLLEDAVISTEQTTQASVETTSEVADKTAVETEKVVETPEVSVSTQVEISGEDSEQPVVTVTTTVKTPKPEAEAVSEDLKPEQSEETTVVEPSEIPAEKPLEEPAPAATVASVQPTTQLTTQPTTQEKQKPEQATKKPVVVTIKLPTNSLAKRAEKYQPLVEQYSDKNKLDDSLVFAVMHTESAFNPVARSGIPAYGLMQIVPESAGRDVANRLYGEPKLFSPDYLYHPENNIQAGTTYLNILYYSYLKGIKDEEARWYCAIAAYNTGAGNVAKAFTGNRNLRKALPEINALSADEVYQKLLVDLPYDETRKYLEKVTRRQQLYVN